MTSEYGLTISIVVSTNNNLYTPVSQTHARSEICVGMGLPRTILRGASWRATFSWGIAWGLGGDCVGMEGSVAKVVCSERGYGKMCGD